MFIGLTRVVDCFELDVGCLGVHSLYSPPLLDVSLDVPIGLGIVISADKFTLSTTHKMWGSGWGLPPQC